MKYCMIVVLLIILSPNPNVNGRKSKSSHHFVLVHGAGHGGWCWYKVATLLKSTGHNVTAIDLTASGINPIQVNQINGSVVDYNKPLMDFMGTHNINKVILVGHSLGGLSISLAMESFPHKISAAVFVSASMPGLNLTFLNIFQEFSRRSGSFLDSKFIFGNGPNNPATALKQVKLSKERYGSVDRVFIVCDQDLTADESFQRWMIERNPPHQVKLINGTDHMVMITKPLNLFTLLLEVAETYY
ncbi:hypothetical protein F8388_017091 [Cannabis sativa]|uniref:AB hydrolase-1 domain-containing protein n=1 Tax=Cannabis sativa TaxID=3483 RepID=A0A7J6GD57_CANSA|nr:hypothetical protein F8388_017091 [Cannabis sativa]KAF4393147.1 hypothetical protein G4B88_001881 [Cannabis sativa]